MVNLNLTVHVIIAQNVLCSVQVKEANIISSISVYDSSNKNIINLSINWKCLSIQELQYMLYTAYTCTE